MAHRLLAAAFATLFFVGGLFAADAVVTKWDDENKKVTLKIEDKETTVELKDVKIFYRGKEMTDLSKVRFREKEKVEVKQEEGKITEIRISPRKP